MKKLFLLLLLCITGTAYGQQKTGISGVIILEHVDTSMRTPFGEYIFLARTVQLQGLQTVSAQTFWNVYIALGEHYTYFITKNVQIAEAFAAKKKDEVIILEGAPLKPLNWWGNEHFRILSKDVRQKYPKEANKSMNTISFAHLYNYSMFVPQSASQGTYAPPFASQQPRSEFQQSPQTWQQQSSTTTPPLPGGKRRVIP